MTRSGELLQAIITRLQEHTDVRAVWLSGSRGRGGDDEYSDIDIWIALQDEIMRTVVADPLAWVHTIVPTMMHVLAPGIAPPGGAFVGSWVPVDDAFVQVDWYIVPVTSAVRDADTRLVFGDVPVVHPVAPSRLPGEVATGKVRDNLVLALLMVNNLVKHARRGLTWRAADHARYADRCLANATWLLETGTEPGYAASTTTFLPEPVRNDADGVRQIARLLLAATEKIAVRAELADVISAPVAAMHAVLMEWEDTAFVPPDEYYRSLARRRVGAGVLVTDEHGRVLLLQTTYKPTYEIPGGVCEQGEAPREAVGREVREEIGLELEVGPLLVFDHYSEPDPKGDAIVLVYDGGTIPDSSGITVDGREIASCRFVDPADLERFTTGRMATCLRAALDARQQRRTFEVSNGAVVRM